MQAFTWLWPALSLPVMLAFFGIFAVTRPQGVSVWRSLAKCGATFMAAITAVLGIVLYERDAGSWLLAAGLMLCCIADFVIERSFIGGVAGFALAHAAFIWYILTLNRPVWQSVPIALALFGLAALLFSRELKQFGKMRVLLLLYAAMLSAMAALALALPAACSMRYARLALGAAAFAVSDIFVAKDALLGATDRQRNGALLLYDFAVYAMAAVLLVP